MKLKLIILVALILVGVLVAGSVITDQENVTKEYNSYLAVARENAERQIPYVAYKNYQSAMAIRGGDEQVFQEYLAQAKLLGLDMYNSAIEEYYAEFPDSVLANELYCGVLYERGSYKNLISAALKARDKGIATEKVRDWYLECSFMLEGLISGFEEANSFIGAYARVKVNDKYGYVSDTGSYLLSAMYEGASMMMSSAAVNDGEEWHLINSQGYKIQRTNVPVDFIGTYSGGKFAVAIGDKYGYTDASLVIPEKLPYEYASTFKSGRAAVKKDGKWAVINENEQPITDFIFEEVVLDEFDTCINGGVIFVKHNGKYYMMNSNGERITQTAFDAVYPFVNAEPAAVCINGKWGFVDTAGNVVIKPAYENAKSFSAGLGAVCVEGKWGYINTSGTIRIEPKFEDCRPFSASGIAALKEGGIWSYKQLLPYHD